MGLKGIREASERGDIALGGALANPLDGDVLLLAVRLSGKRPNTSARNKNLFLRAVRRAAMFDNRLEQ